MTGKKELIALARFELASEGPKPNIVVRYEWAVFCACLYCYDETALIVLLIYPFVGKTVVFSVQII